VLARGLLAENLLGQGKKEEAVALLQEGLKSTPTAPLLHREMAASSSSPADPARRLRPTGPTRGSLPTRRMRRSFATGRRDSKRLGGGHDPLRVATIVGLLAVALPGSGVAQGLGDAAARERARRRS